MTGQHPSGTPLASLSDPWPERCLRLLNRLRIDLAGAQLREWNANVPPGSPVLVWTPGAGGVRAGVPRLDRTVTWAVRWDCGAGASVAVVFVQGKLEPVALDLVDPDPEREP